MTMVVSTDLVIATSNDVKDAAAAKDIYETLARHYPGYAWGVNADSETGMITIVCLNLSGEWGYNLRYAEYLCDSTNKVVVRAGGEILERFKVKRGTVDHDQVDNLKSIAGRTLFDTDQLANGQKAPKIIVQGNDLASKGII